MAEHRVCYLTAHKLFCRMNVLKLRHQNVKNATPVLCRFVRSAQLRNAGYLVLRSLNLRQRNLTSRKSEIFHI
jgi:hypothetical protein